MHTIRRELLFSLIITLLCVILLFLDIGHIPKAPEGIRCRAQVTEVDNSKVRTNLIVKTNIQMLHVRLLAGPHKGQELAVANMLTGKMELDEFYEKGSTILVEYSAPDGKPVNALARGAYRLDLQMYLVGLFALLLVAVAGVTGLKAGLFYGGGMDQLIVQLTGVVATAVYVLIVSSICWIAIKATMGLRVSAEEETEGLDHGEHGNEAYHGFVMARGHD